VNPIEMLRRRWQDWTGEEETPFDGDTPAWMISLGALLTVLVVLSLIRQPPRKHDFMLTVNSLDSQDVEQLPDAFDASNDPAEESGAASLAGESAAMAFAPLEDQITRAQTEPLPNEAASIVAPELIELATAPTVEESLTVKGSAGVGATGAVGAVDVLTDQIAASLEDRPTLVVWILDQSLSMQPKRQAIVDRLDRIYAELGVKAAGGEQSGGKQHAPLLTSVMAFGQKISFRTDSPTDDAEEVKKAILAIENDESGTEMVFGAVGMAAEKFKTFRTQSPRRNVMLIVFTDEVGDDEARMEDALKLCQHREIPVYVVGTPAPFGRREIEVAYVDPDPKFDQTVQMVPVRQGPESLYPEGVQLAFAGHGHDDLLRLDSGFGPFALTRLCYETGGMYIAVHPNRVREGKRAGATAAMSARLDYFFDPAIMRNYQPEYVSMKEYEQKLMRNKARAALVTAAKMSMVDPMENPTLEFPKTDEGAFKRSLDDAQKVAAKIGPKLDMLYQTLKEGEKDRPKLIEPRWQAGYDLALGRILAIKVRTEAYNAMLAKAKGGLKFEKPESDTFVLKPADEISVGSALEKMAKQSRELLTRVKQQHSGTPWGLLAAAELEEPIGWKWSEKESDVKRQKRMPGGGGNGGNPKDQLKKLEKPKPKRPSVKL
jgi:hypothetical protein